MSKTIEHRIHDALRAGKSLTISYADLYEFVYGDDAIMTRLMNAAANEGGIDEYGWGNQHTLEEYTWAELAKGKPNA